MYSNNFFNQIISFPGRYHYSNLYHLQTYSALQLLLVMKLKSSLQKDLPH